MIICKRHRECPQSECEHREPHDQQFLSCAIPDCDVMAWDDCECEEVESEIEDAD